MRSDSVASFLDLARENRLLEPDQFDDLFRQPDVPQSNLAALCDFLLSRKVLTAYQADMIRAGRGYDLSFAGYPVYDDLGPCPGGTAYRVAHPSLRTPLVLRRLRADWLAPADNVAAFIQRAQAASPVADPHLVHLLDAGVHRDEPFVVLEPADGADLGTLIADIGPMPTPLAVEYIRQAGRGLAAAHARDLPHGDVRPANLTAGPLVMSSKKRPDGTFRSRPASTATVRVAEFGLTPRRPAGATDPYHPPEYATDATPTKPGDVFLLAGCLHFLLTGKAPGSAALQALRPDTPPTVAELVARMLSPDPTARPTIDAVLTALDAAVAPASPPPKPKPKPIPFSPTETSSILTGDSVRAPAANDVGVLLLTDAPTPPAVELTEPGAVELVSESDVFAPSPAEVVEVDPLATASSGLKLPEQVGAAGWEAYGQTPAAPAPVPPPAFVPPPMAWAPQPFVPTAMPDEREDRTAPGYDPIADGVSMRRKPRPPVPGAKGKLWMWLGIGIGLNVLAIVIWVVLMSGGSDPDPEPRPVKPPIKKKDGKGRT